MTGIISNAMKIVKIIPNFKSGNTFSFKNYRPISILPAFSKIIMHFTLLNFLNSSEQYYKHQYGSKVTRVYILIESRKLKKMTSPPEISLTPLSWI